MYISAIYSTHTSHSLLHPLPSTLQPTLSPPAEITAPRLEKCPANVQVTTSRGGLTEVQRPAVVFRTGEGRLLNGTCSYFGEREAHNFTLGRHHIECKAFDPSFGEMATSVCRFVIRVKCEYTPLCKFIVSPTGFCLKLKLRY